MEECLTLEKGVLGSSLNMGTVFCREHGGSVVECLTRDLGAVGSSLTGVTVLCP